MTRALYHQPEGDHNPYDPAPGSRHPLTPTDTETVRVGVVVSGSVSEVRVEWEEGERVSAVSLEAVDGSDEWIGVVGPFPASTRYRFVTSEGEGTDWYRLPVMAWTAGRFVGLAVDGAGVVAVLDSGGFLRLEPGDDALRWIAGPGEWRGGLCGEVLLGRWRLEVDGGALHLISAGRRVVIDSVSLGAVDGCLTEISLSWLLDQDEALFGGGERFDRLNQRGLSPDVRVYEQYKRQGSRTYFPLPWLLSSRGYGLHVHGAGRIRFDLGAGDGDRAVARIPASERAGGRWYFGPPAEVLGSYVSEIGLPTPLPVWAYGPWMSGNEWDRDSRIREVVERTVAERIPATVVVIEAWSDETTFYLFNDTTYQPVGGAEAVASESMRHGGRWPDPKGLVDWLHRQGLRVLLWQIPVLKDGPGHPQHDADVEHADRAGYCVQRVDGEPYRNRGWWFPRARVLDMSNPEARRWWFTKRAYLVEEFGVDGFKTDGGEHLWGSDVVTALGETGDEAANRYPTHYLGAYHEFLSGAGHTRPLTFSRAGFTGSQAFPAHWAGDEDSTWAAYRASLIAGLTAGLSGIAFWGWDLAGFSGPLPDAELYKRAAAMAAFCPIMQYHSEHNEHRRPLADRTPWNVAEQTGDPTVADVYAFYAHLRMNLVPYLYQSGNHASETGQPLMRALALDFADDPVAVGVDDQYLLGPDLMVAPVLDPGVHERPVYIPADGWCDLWSGRPVPAGWVAAGAEIDVIPVYVRSGAAIPLWMNEPVLGSPVGLPGSGDGSRVVMIFPGTRETPLVDPVTDRVWLVETRIDGDRLRVSVTNVPERTTLWIREPGEDQVAVLEPGSTTLSLRLRSV